MDKGTKIYAAVLAVVLVLLAVVFLYEDPKVSELNARLEADREIAAFPYRFRVLEVKNSLAMMSTPRSTEVPVDRVLGLLFPAVSRRPSDSPEFQEAQQRLARVQTRARDLVLDDAQIQRVSWVLDRDWLRDHGILLTP